MTTARIQLRSDLAINWTNNNPTLSVGELGYETDTRKYKFGDGSTAWTGLAYASSTSGLSPNGTPGSPNVITAVGGISILGNQRELQFIKGSGVVTITANPQIEAGTTLGQELILQGEDNTNTVTLNNGNGLNLSGAIVIGATGPGSQIYLVWNGTVWSEVSRR